MGQICIIKSVYSTAVIVANVAVYVSVLNFFGKGTGMKWIPGVTYFRRVAQVLIGFEIAGAPVFGL